MIAEMFFSPLMMLVMQSAPIIASRGGPEIAWSCNLKTREDQTLVLIGKFGKIPADPKDKNIDGYKNVKVHFSQDSSGFFDPIADAWVNDITEEFGITGRVVEQDGSRVKYSLYLQLGDDGVGIGSLQSYTSMPKDYKHEFGKRFVHDRNLATGFCSHETAKLRPI